ncbi:uncharacterized protein [Montipora capricornis]|uniref:uncharacterized protein isoform X1 n=1 Tax=Montipora capricornis TaxID=246305 RepID=UPI0035F150BF
MNLVLSLSAIFSVITVISEAAVIEDKTNRTSEGWLAPGRANRNVCEAYDVLFPDGYCEHILGNSPVFGKTKEDLRNNENSMLRYNLLKVYSKFYKELDVRESCLAAVDDIYCHYYFPRCYISSPPQPVCREACEEKFLKVCDHEIKVAKTFNEDNPVLSWPYYWDIINCTTLPYRNQTSNCYYPDVIQDQLNILESKECFYGDGRGYHGNKNTTVSGYKCQSWNATTPREHDITGLIYEEITNCTNLCRNPGGFGLDGPWCFTTSDTVQWEYCGLPRCAKKAPSSTPSGFRGHNVSSTSIQVNWEDVPKSSVNGILLGFHVACNLVNCSEEQVMDLPRENHSCVFRGLEKYKNYSCCLRAYNNFGNGSWSEELVISTDEDVPGAPPESLKAWNQSSTSLYAEWSPIPFGERNGRILGYIVEIKSAEEKGGRGEMKNFTRSRNVTFTRLKKYHKYMVKVRGLTQRGEGPVKDVTAQTDEDVPDHPPLNISATTIGSSAVLLEWNPVPPEHTNGKVLGYKVFYGDENGTTRGKSTVSTGKTFQNIEGLTPHTNYIFQILAFTAKGDGTTSAPYYVKTGAPPPLLNEIYKDSTGAITAAVLSGIAVLAGVFLTIWYIRKKRRQVERENNDGNDPHPLVTPYAASSPDWLERIIASHNYEIMENEVDEDVPATCQRVPYINIAPNGSLKLPPYLRNIFLEFERYYENTRYQRLKRGRRFIGWTSDANDGLLYDTLQRGMPVPSVSPNSLSREPAHQTTVKDSREGLKRHSISLGELRGVREAVQDKFCSTQPVEIDTVGCTTSHNRRRFSVDLGEVREFIAMTEMKSTPTENPAVADHWPADMRETHQSESLANQLPAAYV